MSSQTNSINLIYIRAAIRKATGIELSLTQVKQYLLEEGLITPHQAKNHATIFRGYGEFYETDYSDYKETNANNQELDFNEELHRNDLKNRS